MTELLNMVGAIATMMMGAMGLFAPRMAAGFVGLQAETPAGRSEFRATYGGLFVAMGVVPLLTMHPLAFATAALCWIGAAMGRAVSIVLDGAATPKNFGAVAFECAFALLLVIGAPWSALWRAWA
ncbi:MAG: DUF4345 family protein [Pseudomonadota bacterium]